MDGVEGGAALSASPAAAQAGGDLQAKIMHVFNTHPDAGSEYGISVQAVIAQLSTLPPGEVKAAIWVDPPPFFSFVFLVLFSLLMNILGFAFLIWSFFLSSL